MSEPLRVAVVGLASWYSVSFAKALRQLGPHRVDLVGAAHLGVPDSTLAGLSRLSRDVYAAQFDVPVLERVEDLLADQRPQLVCVTAPDTEKAHYAELALAAGCDVYLSKPLSATVASAHRIRAAARAHPDRLVGGLNPARFATAIREGYRRVQAGEIGEVLTARAWVQHGAPDPRAPREGSPETGEGQGGIAFSLGVYASDMLNWFIGAAAHPYQRAYAEYDTLNSPGYPWPDAGKAVVRYASGKMGSMDLYYSVPMPAPQWEIEVCGRDGLLRTNGGNYEGMIWRRGGLDRPRLEPFAPTRDDTIYNAMDHVVTCCELRTPFEMDAEDGYRAIELCAAWQRSARTHQPVALPLPVEEASNVAPAGH